MDGAKKFMDAADKFFEDVCEMIDSNTVIQRTENVDDMYCKQTIVDIDRAEAIADLIYKVSQSIKMMRGEEKTEKSAKKANMSMVDRWAEEKKNS